MNVFFLAGSKGGLNRSNALKKSIKKLRIKIVIRWLAGFSGVAMQKKVEDKKKKRFLLFHTRFSLFSYWRQGCGCALFVAVLDLYGWA